MSAHRLEDQFDLVIIHDAYVVRHSDGGTYIAAWVELHNEHLPLGSDVPSLFEVLNSDGTLLDNSSSMYAVEKAVKNTAIEWRVKQIREELGFTGEITDLDTIGMILKLVWAGEWMGQFNNGGTIYFQELAKLLEIDMFKMHDLVQVLVEKRIADILPSTWILAEPGEEPMDGTEEAFGHKKFVSSDFGWWSCRACEQNGSDYDNPEDYPCVEEAQA